VIYGGKAYKLFLFLHLVSVIVGFGPWMINGLLPQLAAKRSRDEARSIAGVVHQVSSYSQYAIYGVLIFGFATLASAEKAGGKKVIDFSDTWVWLSVLLWVVIVGVMHGLAFPTQRKLRDGDGDPATLARNASLVSAIVNLLVLAVIALMIQEPGTKIP
jgi:hypothetical protein